MNAHHETRLSVGVMVILIVMLLLANNSAAFISIPRAAGKRFSRSLSSASSPPPPSSAQSSSQSSSISTASQTQQWEGFLKHKGVWCGVQSTFFHTDSEDAADQLLCGTSLQADSSLSLLNHTKFFVDGDLDLEDSLEDISPDKIVKTSMVYKSKDPLMQKVCKNVLLGLLYR